MNLSDFLLTLKGSFTSGNWGHAGRPGKHGGSATGGGHSKIGLKPGDTQADKNLRVHLTRMDRTPGKKKSSPVEKKGPVKKVEPEKKIEPKKEELKKEAKPQEKISQGIIGEDKYTPSSETKSMTAKLNRELKADFKKRDDLEAKIAGVKQAYLKAEVGSKEGRELSQRLRGLREDLQKLDSSMTLTIQKTVYPPTRGDLKLKSGFDDFNGSGKVGTNELNKMLHPSTTKGVELAANFNPSLARSHYDLKGTMQFNLGGMNSKTWVHEAGHLLEDKNPSLAKKAQDFLSMRTKKEPLRKMSEITGDPGYRDDEVTKKDKFIHPYMGKEYKTEGKTYATEIFSMGLEMMYDNPGKLLKQDPEYFSFMVDTMNGR